MPLAAEGRSNTDIALAVATSRATVQQWRNRFAAEGLASVSAIRPGRRRKPQISQDELRELIAVTVGTEPAGGSWTCRGLARHLGVSPATISRVWRPPKTAQSDYRPVLRWLALRRPILLWLTLRRRVLRLADSAALLRQGRLALANHRWEDAYQLLAAADDAGALGPADIESLAEAAAGAGGRRSASAPGSGFMRCGRGSEITKRQRGRPANSPAAAGTERRRPSPAVGCAGPNGIWPTTATALSR